MTTPSDQPLTVSRFEANLLRLTRFILRQVPAEQAVGLVENRTTRPPCLSPACLHLLRDTLGKGCVLRLARSGWRRATHLRAGQPVTGRHWERTPPAELGLTFSGQTVEFLLWLTAETPRDGGAGWKPKPKELTVGDRLLIYFAYAALRNEPEAAAGLRARPVIKEHPLIRLACADDFTATADADTELDFTPWVTGDGALVLEALQADLAESWRQMEIAKGQVSDWGQLNRFGIAQETALEPFTRACTEAQRPDLARFLLVAVGGLLEVDRQPSFWVGGLQGAAPPRLADQIATRRSALAALRQMSRFRQWEQWARSVGPFDEGYRVAQLWLSDWEQHHGPARAARAENILRQVEPLRVQSAQTTE